VDVVETFVEYLRSSWFANSYTHMIAAMLIIVFTLIVRWLFSRMFKAFIRRSTDQMKNDPTNYKFLRHSIEAVIYVVGFSAAIYAIPSLRTFAGSLLAGAGILAVVIGFASQQALSNTISGFFIVMFKPFRVNDRIFLRDSSARGVVEDITLRHTVIRDFENRRIVIPNSVISEELLINADYKDKRICKHFQFRVGLQSDIKKVREIIQEEAIKHPNCIDYRTPEQKRKGEKQVVVRVTDIGEYAIEMKAWVWAANYVNAFVMSCDLYETIIERFREEGIEIPVPYRHLINNQ
jgi:small-conductance mechanosensitive channel